MSNKDFNRAANFLQGALNAAIFEAARKRNLPPPENHEVKPVIPSGPMLPGFEGMEPRAPETASVAGAEPPPAPDAIISRAVPATEAPADEAGFSASSPACPSVAPAFDIRKAAALAGLVAAVGLVIVAACKLIPARTVVREVEKEVQAEPDGVPLALLPDAADPRLWNTVSEMTGSIDGVEVAFRRGLARGSNGVTYRLQLDFCRTGNDIYAKVVGDKAYVVKLNPLGEIVKAYPAPRNNKPLKAIFGR